MVVKGKNAGELIRDGYHMVPCHEAFVTRDLISISREGRLAAFKRTGTAVNGCFVFAQKVQAKSLGCQPVRC